MGIRPMFVDIYSSPYPIVLSPLLVPYSLCAFPLARRLWSGGRGVEPRPPAAEKKR